MRSRTIEELVGNCSNKHNREKEDYNCDFNEKECPLCYGSFCPMRCAYAINKYLPKRKNKN